MADIPVYLIAGFLDGGKTDFINGILEDGFARRDRTLLLCCEEGEVEWDEKSLQKGIDVLKYEEFFRFHCAMLYRRKEILIIIF